MPLPQGIELRIARELGVRRGRIVYLLEVKKHGFYKGNIVGYKNPMTRIVKCFPERGRKLEYGTFPAGQDFPIEVCGDELLWARKEG